MFTFLVFGVFFLPVGKWGRVCLVQNVEAKLCLQNNVSGKVWRELLCLPNSWGATLLISTGVGL